MTKSKRCRNYGYQLTDCTDSENVKYTCTDLEEYLGQIVKIQDDDDICRSIGTIQMPPEGEEFKNLSIRESYESCERCQMKYVLIPQGCSRIYEEYSDIFPCMGPDSFQINISFSIGLGCRYYPGWSGCTTWADNYATDLNNVSLTGGTLYRSSTYTYEAYGNFGTVNYQGSGTVTDPEEEGGEKCPSPSVEHDYSGTIRKITLQVRSLYYTVNVFWVDENYSEGAFRRLVTLQIPKDSTTSEGTSNFAFDQDTTGCSSLDPGGVAESFNCSGTITREVPYAGRDFSGTITISPIGEQSANAKCSDYVESIGYDPITFETIYPENTIFSDSDLWDYLNKTVSYSGRCYLITSYYESSTPPDYSLIDPSHFIGIYDNPKSCCSIPAPCINCPPDSEDRTSIACVVDCGQGFTFPYCSASIGTESLTLTPSADCDLWTGSSTSWTVRLEYKSGGYYEVRAYINGAIAGDCDTDGSSYAYFIPTSCGDPENPERTITDNDFGGSHPVGSVTLPAGSFWDSAITSPETITIIFT